MNTAVVVSILVVLGLGIYIGLGVNKITFHHEEAFSKLKDCKQLKAPFSLRGINQMFTILKDVVSMTKNLMCL